jgi:Uma2 family endonuclease
MVQQLDNPRLTENYPKTIDPDLYYPESDGKPLADNTIQFRLIIKIQGGIDTLFIDNPEVFVAGDLLWYPVEGSLKSQAPDVMVVFGRPKGDRRSYKQWQEDNLPPQVVFEILSPNNTAKEMRGKFAFYQEHGVEEYYLYDPEENSLKGWLRQGSLLEPIPLMENWVSPRLGSRFETTSGMLELYRPDGKRLETYVEVAQRAEQEAQARQAAMAQVEQGLERERAFILRLLRRSVSEIPPALQTRIESLSQAQLEDLGEASLDFTEVADLASWLNQAFSNES